jgi:hypothetical protein
VIFGGPILLAPMPPARNLSGVDKRSVPRSGWGMIFDDVIIFAHVPKKTNFSRRSFDRFREIPERAESLDANHRSGDPTAGARSGNCRSESAISRAQDRGGRCPRLHPVRPGSDAWRQLSVAFSKTPGANILHWACSTLERSPAFCHRIVTPLGFCSGSSQKH